MAPDEPTGDEIRTLIEHVDDVCRDAESIRAYADEAMRRRLFWPEQVPDAQAPHVGDQRPD